MQAITKAHKHKHKQHLNASDLPFLEIARKPEPPPGSARASLGGLGWVSRCAFWRLWRCKFRQSRDRETAHLSSDRDRGATAPSSRPRRCSVRPPLQFPRHRAVVTSTLRRVHSSRPVAPVVLVQRHQPTTHHPARPAAPPRSCHAHALQFPHHRAVVSSPSVLRPSRPSVSPSPRVVSSKLRRVLLNTRLVPRVRIVPCVRMRAHAHTHTHTSRPARAQCT